MSELFHFVSIFSETCAHDRAPPTVLAVVNQSYSNFPRTEQDEQLFSFPSISFNFHESGFFSLSFFLSLIIRAKKAIKPHHGCQAASDATTVPVKIRHRKTGDARVLCRVLIEYGFPGNSHLNAQEEAELDYL